MALLAGLIGFGVVSRRRSPGAVGLRDARLDALLPLAVTIGVAILGNAAVCGVFANPHDRYGARIVWLATLAVAIAPWLLAPSRPLSRRPDRPLSD